MVVKVKEKLEMTRHGKIIFQEDNEMQEIMIDFNLININVKFMLFNIINLYFNIFNQFSFIILW